MARVKDIQIDEVPKEIRPIYKKFIENYGPFSNQAKVFAHRPIIFKYMMSMLMEMADKPIIDKRYLEIAIVSVSAIKPSKSINLSMRKFRGKFTWFCY